MCTINILPLCYKISENRQTRKNDVDYTCKSGIMAIKVNNGSLTQSNYKKITVIMIMTIFVNRNHMNTKLLGCVTPTARGLTSSRRFGKILHIF